MEYIIGPNGEQYDPKAFGELLNAGTLGPGVDWIDIEGTARTTREQIPSKLSKGVSANKVPQQTVEERPEDLDPEILEIFQKAMPQYDDYTITEIVRGLNEAGAFDELEGTPQKFEKIDVEPMQINSPIEELP